MYDKLMYINIDLKIDTAGNESNGPMFRCNTHKYISWTTSAMQIYIYILGISHVPCKETMSICQDGLTGSAWGDWANYTASPLRAEPN